MPKTKVQLRDLAFVIDQAIRRLPNGESRFALSAGPLSHPCLTGFTEPTLSEKVASDYEMPSGNELIRSAYQQEIEILEEILREAKVPVSLAAWQQSRSSETGDMMRALNRRSYAIQMWNWYAIPWRYRAATVYVVYAPDDALGSPIIDQYPADHFLRALAQTTARRHAECARVTTQLFLWKNLGGGALLVLAFALVTFLTAGDPVVVNTAWRRARTHCK